MKYVIRKFELETKGRTHIQVPAISEILSINVQNLKPFLFVLIDPDETNLETIIIEGFEEGDEIHYNMGVSREYLNSASIFPDNSLIIHYFIYTGV